MNLPTTSNNDIMSLVQALNCRSSGGPKEAELKTIYKKCLKMQEGKNSSKGNSEQDYKEPRNQIQRNDWEKGRTTGSKENKNSRDDRNSGKDRKGGSGMRDRDDMMGRTDDRMDRNDDRKNRNDDRMSSNNDRNGGRNGGRMGGTNNRNDMTGSRNVNFNGREDFGQSDEYGSVSKNIFSRI